MRSHRPTENDEAQDILTNNTSGKSDVAVSRATGAPAGRQQSRPDWSKLSANQGAQQAVASPELPAEAVRRIDTPQVTQTETPKGEAVRTIDKSRPTSTTDEKAVEEQNGVGPRRANGDSQSEQLDSQSRLRQANNGEEAGLLGSQRGGTCNITALAKALEGLGKGIGDFLGSHELVLAAGSVFPPRVSTRRLQGKRKSSDWADMGELDLPAFLELVAIAELATGISTGELKAAATTARNKILDMYFLTDLAARFGVTGDVRIVDAPEGKDQQVPPSSKADRGKPSKIAGESDVPTGALSGTKNRRKAKDLHKSKAVREVAKRGAATVPALDDYKRAIGEQVGTELDEGKAILVPITGHISEHHVVRVKEVCADYIVIDDPTSAQQASRRVSWLEARAMGYFNKYLVLG